MEGIEIHTDVLPQWVFVVFLLIFSVLALMRASFPNRFTEFLKLPVNNRFVVIYEKKEKKIHIFTFISLVLQWISLSLLVYVWLLFYHVKLPFITGVDFLDLALLLLGFLGLKYFFQKNLIHLFDLRYFGKSYIYNRIIYSSYASFLTVILLFLVVYVQILNAYSVNFLFFILLIVNLLSWFTFIKTNQLKIKPYLIYFILYLCTFEIAPYVFLMYGLEFV